MIEPNHNPGRATDAPSPERRHAASILLPLALIALGPFLLAVIGVFDALWLMGRPFHAAAVVLDANASPPEGAHAVAARTLPPDQVPDDAPWKMPPAEEVPELVRADYDLIIEHAAEHIIAADLSASDFEALTAEGVPPEPGQPEVIAGVLARADTFTIDGVAFTVTGRIDAGASGLAFAYLLPMHPNFDALFANHPDARTGWVHPSAVTDPDVLAEPEEDDAATESTPEEERRTVLAGFQPGPPAFQWLTILALIVVAVGASLLAFRIVRLALVAALPILAPVARQYRRRRALAVGCHVAAYGLFFVAMAEGIQDPHGSYFLATYVTNAFTEGELAHIGEAYASANILQAAWATWQNNYLLQTLGLTFAISIPPFALGAVKTAASLALAGYVLTPVWAGTAAGYTFHCMTMVLEFEAYILAAFAAIVWPLELFKRVREDASAMTLRQLLYFEGAATIVCGVVLAVGAFYEAITLILFQ